MLGAGWPRAATMKTSQRIEVLVWVLLYGGLLAPNLAAFGVVAAVEFDELAHVGRVAREVAAPHAGEHQRLVGSHLGDVGKARHVGGLRRGGDVCAGPLAVLLHFFVE